MFPGSANQRPKFEVRLSSDIASKWAAFNNAATATASDHSNVTDLQARATFAAMQTIFRSVEASESNLRRKNQSRTNLAIDCSSKLFLLDHKSPRNSPTWQKNAKEYALAIAGLDQWDDPPRFKRAVYRGILLALGGRDSGFFNKLADRLKNRSVRQLKGGAAPKRPRGMMSAATPRKSLLENLLLENWKFLNLPNQESTPGFCFFTDQAIADYLEKAFGEHFSVDSLKKIRGRRKRVGKSPLGLQLIKFGEAIKEASRNFSIGNSFQFLVRNVKARDGKCRTIELS